VTIKKVLQGCGGLMLPRRGELAFSAPHGSAGHCPSAAMHACHGSMRANCLHIKIHKMGACKCFVHDCFQANASPWSTAMHLHCRLPSAGILLSKNYTCSYDSLVKRSIECLSWPMQSNYPNFIVHEVGPCEDTGVVAYGLFWANSSSSAKAEYLNHGPMREP
jgi:hypothetical protein